MDFLLWARGVKGQPRSTSATTSEVLRICCSIRKPAVFLVPLLGVVIIVPSTAHNGNDPNSQQPDEWYKEQQHLCVLAVVQHKGEEALQELVDLPFEAHSQLILQPVPDPLQVGPHVRNGRRAVLASEMELQHGGHCVIPEEQLQRRVVHEEVGQPVALHPQVLHPCRPDVPIQAAKREVVGKIRPGEHTKLGGPQSLRKFSAFHLLRIVDKDGHQLPLVPYCMELRVVQVLDLQKPIGAHPIYDLGGIPDTIVHLAADVIVHYQLLP
mmetsp:Transcript_43468/g.78086  ORF Transcript_43468/g.78086 Transcript_43468/m.78086 type:complete len:268 (+) Transcript_43468:902-1705(+)